MIKASSPPGRKLDFRKTQELCCGGLSLQIAAVFCAEALRARILAMFSGTPPRMEQAAP
jgi:hypothetical protein